MITLALLKYDEMDSPIGPLTLGMVGEGASAKLCQIEFGAFHEAEDKLRAWSKRWYGETEWRHDPGHLAPAAEQLREYFAGIRTSFDLPLELRGTTFQQKVWQALMDIPYGQACSYRDIGYRIDAPKAVRAVGGANHNNPVPIIVPCHRVIGASGAMVGYGGGLQIKTFLLQLEGFPV
ncbi:methylated-DNA--[protein]-cysteine S-methyltransferase [Paenibacillus sp. GD4]|uniref:methylated-DNA--[protein]-cysteine S-methyltransferase n=1 Tax=Paenibacillus TaxID=44249 RepID=UPI00254364EB|nr:MULTISPECIES: methylated-DNA--[protein]-cysteine S-methyltransferase [Paenibacillus]MDQ1911582.1 methylated-DNA--[protein]-cysteine S-methyltransferase [Paenibacillus sp. GD4]